jgi:putative transposase
VRKTFQYRLYPTKKQETLILKTLSECRWLYNHLLEQRKTTYEQSGESLSLYDQQSTFTLLKQQRPSLKIVHSQVLQNVAVRLDLAFKAFFRRVKDGDNPGFPRFRGANRYDSFCYPQSGFKLKENKVYLSKIGDIQAVIHTRVEGTIKTCCIKRSSTGKWYVSFSCEIEESKPLPVSAEQQVGIDVGLESFAHFSTDERIDNPRFFRKEEKQLAKVQSKLSETEKGTSERKHRRKAVSRVHERIKFKRQNFAHQEARKIVNRFGFIAVEDLEVNRMMHNHCLAKSIGDAAWRGFANCLSNKAAEAGRKYVAVNPAYTSQQCSKCGHRQKLKLDERQYSCTCCGFSTSRDHNAALNILAIGLYSIGNQSVEAPEFIRGE